tara:strand:- start:148 stop:330 length:183 start_codon:yes stop_codon:yes gene_type:complete
VGAVDIIRDESLLLEDATDEFLELLLLSINILEFSTSKRVISSLGTDSRALNLFMFCYCF